MNREEAQFILGAYRLNSEDAHDPQFQEALALARQDPALGRWFAEEQAFDRAFTAKIRSRPIPADLKTQLLLARATIHHVRWWRRPGWLALAAGVGILLIVASVLPWRSPGAAEFSGFRRAMAAVSQDMTNHADIAGLDTAGYRRWLAEHRGAADFNLPAGLPGNGIMACKIVEWQQERVTMLCFKVSGQHLDVFVVNAASLPGVSLDAEPAFFADGETTTAAWRRDGKIYLVAGTMPKSDLQQLL